MKSISVLVLAVVLLSACGSNPADVVDANPMRSPEACAAADGEWIRFKDLYPGKDLGEDDLRRYVCNIRTHDAGTACTDDRQCQGYCAAPSGAESGQSVTGECSVHVQWVSGTLTVFEGRVRYPRSSTGVTPRKSAMLNALEAAQKRWSSHGIVDYEITLADENCFCLYGPYYGPNRVIVRNNRVARVIYQGEYRDGFRRGDSLTREKALKLTIDEVFDRLEGTIRRMTANAILNVKYDPEYGFPTLIDFDRPDVGDVQSRLIVRDFRSH